MMQHSYADFYENHPVYSGFAAKIEIAGSIGVEFISVDHDDFECVDPTTNTLLIGMPTEPTAKGCIEVDYGHGRKSLQFNSHHCYINPAFGDTALRQITPAGRTQMLFVSASWRKIAEAMRIEQHKLLAPIEPLYEQMLLLPQIRTMSRAMRDASCDGGAHAALAIDQGLLSIVASLLHFLSSGRFQTHACPNLEDRRLVRVIDYIETNIRQPLTVGELADIARISIFHFGRAFKAAVGETPHRYVMRRRVEHAKPMLLVPDISVASVAIDCGFASQSHMTVVFRWQVGATPREWRQKVLEWN